MTISKRVQKELVQAVPAADVAAVRSLTGRSGRPAPQPSKSSSRSKDLPATTASLAEASKGKAWTREEHERFLVALELYPSGPWKAIAEYVGSKNSRQTMTHAQKYRQKHERRQRGLRNKSKSKKTSGSRKAKGKANATGGRTSIKTRVAVVEAMADVEDQSPRSVGYVEDASAAKSMGAGAAFPDEQAASELTESVDAPALGWNLLFKQASVAEIFPDFEPMELLPEMWSTNSLEEMVLGGGSGRFDFFSAESHTAIV